MSDMSPAQRVIPDFQWDVPDRFNFSTDVVDHWAEQGDPLCLIWENAQGAERRFRYSDMALLAGRFARLLLDSGVRKGDRILVVMPRIPEWQIVVTGALRIGAVAIPCIEMLKPSEIAYRAEHAGARAIICRAEHAPNIEDGTGSIPLRFSVGPRDGWEDILPALDALDPAPAATVQAEDPVLMYYTSGSTGYPKGVLHSARGLFTWRYSARYWLDLRPGERIWCTADTGWSKAGTSVFYGPWSEGATAFFYDGPFDPAERLRLLAKHKVTVYCAPATELYRVVGEAIETYDLSALRRTVSAGEAMNPTVAAAWKKATGLDVHEAYGQTETLMTSLTIKGVAPKLGSMGVAAPGCDLSVIDEGGVELPDGELGQFALRVPNPQMMLGYWQAEEATEAAHINGPTGRWFKTGDLGHRDADGYLWYHGRADDVINSAGYRIGPVEVENALLEHDAVQECAVVGAPDTQRGEVVKAFIVLKPGRAANDDLTRDIQNHVKAVASPYKYPRLVEYREALPKGPTGKILRRALKE